MSDNVRAGVARFFTTYRKEIVALTLGVQDEVGGHYAALNAAERVEAAESNVTSFADAVVSGQVPHTGIARLLATHPPPNVVSEIVRMVDLQEQRFALFVTVRVPEDPALAAEIQRRARNVAARFRLALASAGMTELLQRLDSPPPPASHMPPP